MRVHNPIARPDKGAKYVGQSINAKGNERAFAHKEAGRVPEGRESAGRPVGSATARYATGIDPQESVTGSPYLPRS